MKRAILLAALSALLASPAGAQQGQPQKMLFELNFLAGGPQAGFIYAQALGLYSQAGIDLQIEEGKGSATTVQMTATGQVDAGFADAPASMQLAAMGAPVQIIAPVLQTNGFAIVSLAGSGITSPKDLVGKRVAVQPGTAQTTLLDAIFAANGIRPDQVNVINLDPSALVSSLLQKRVDAILGGADYHTIQLQSQGAKVDEILYRDAGVPTVGLSVVARDDKLKANPELYRKFVAVSLEGWDRARKEPRAAAEAVHKAYPSVSTEDVYKQLVVDLKLLCAPGATEMGREPEANWARTYDLLTKYLKLPTTKPVTAYYTNAFLPPNPPKCP